MAGAGLSVNGNLQRVKNGKNGLKSGFLEIRCHILQGVEKLNSLKNYLKLVNKRSDLIFWKLSLPPMGYPGYLHSVPRSGIIKDGKMETGVFTELKQNQNIKECVVLIREMEMTVEFSNVHKKIFKLRTLMDAKCNGDIYFVRLNRIGVNPLGDRTIFPKSNGFHSEAEAIRTCIDELMDFYNKQRDNGVIVDDKWFMENQWYLNFEAFDD